MSIEQIKSYIEAQVEALKKGSVSTNAEANIKQKGMLFAYEDTLEKLNRLEV